MNIKKSRLNREAKASLWYVASNLISRGAGFLLTPIFTRLLSPEEYGIYSIYISLMGIFTVISTLEMSGAVMYRGLAKFEGEGCERFTSSVLGAQCLLSLLSVTLYLVLAPAINKLTSLGTALTLLLLIQIFINAILGIFFASRRYSGRYRSVSAVNIMTGIITPLLALILIALGYRVTARIAASLIVTGIFAIPIFRKMILHGGGVFWKKGWKLIFRLAIPMLPHYLSMSLIAQSDRIIIAHTVGEAAVGKYSAAYSIGFMLSLVSGGIQLALTPWIQKKLARGSVEKVKEAISAASRLTVLATLGFMLLLPEVFRLAVAREYFEALPVAYTVALSVIFSFLSAAAANCLLHYEKPLLITKNSVICAVISILSCIMLTHSIGYIGGAVSTLAAYALLLILNTRSLIKVAPVPLFDGKSFAKLAIFLFCGALLIFMLRASLVSRLLLFAALALISTAELPKYRKLLT